MIALSSRILSLLTIRFTEGREYSLVALKYDEYKYDESYAGRLKRENFSIFKHPKTYDSVLFRQDGLLNRLFTSRLKP